MAYSTIDKPSNNFRTKLYTGTGSATSITFDESTNMQPDFIWVKSRNDTWNHNLVDSVRGALKVLRTNTTEAEENRTNNISSFNSNGFSIAGGDGLVNYSTTTTTYVSWNWKANGTGVSNTAGTISSTVSANTTSGFSIVSYTGNGSTSATVGHGLGVTPAMIIIKNRSAVSQWMVKHKSLATDYNLQLNVTDAQVYLPSGTGQGGVGNLSSSSTFGFTSGTTGVNNVNNSGSSFIAYCFAEVKGFSKFGSYTGNGSADGTFVYTGFKPAFLIVKESSASGNNWQIGDNKRNGYNVIAPRLEASTSSSEYTNLSWVDFVSNGFKIRSSDGAFNTSSNTYIYMAFADSPFCSSKGIPTTAR